MLRLSLVLYLAGVFFAAEAHAQKGNYFGISALGMRYAQDTLPDYETAGAVFKLGSELFPILAIEGHVGLAGSDSNEILGQRESFNLKHFAGVFLRGNIPFERTQVYGLLGYSTANASATSDAVALDGSQDGASFGAGVALFANPASGLHFEWIQYLDEDDFSLTGLNIGFFHRFY